MINDYLRPTEQAKAKLVEILDGFKSRNAKFVDSEYSECIDVISKLTRIYFNRPTITNVVEDYRHSIVDITKHNDGFTTATIVLTTLMLSDYEMFYIGLCKYEEILQSMVEQR